MRVLVTGAGGFIGSRAVELLRDDHELVGIGRTEAPVGLPEGVDWIRADLASPLDVAALPGGVDAVVHLAQSRRYADLPAGASDVFEVNVRSTFELLEYARGAGAAAFVLASSGGVYRRSPEPLTEGDPVQAADLYLGSKLASEGLLGSYAGEFRTVALRPFFVFGPKQPTMMVAGLVRRVVAGEEITVNGDPGLRLNPTFVDDAVAAIGAAIGGDTRGPVNVAGSDVVSFTELVAAIGEIAGTEPRLLHRDAPADHDLVADNSRMRAELGVEPTALRAGLQATIES